MPPQYLLKPPIRYIEVEIEYLNPYVPQEVL